MTQRNHVQTAAQQTGTSHPKARAFDTRRAQIGVRLLAQVTRHVYELEGAALFRIVLRDICRATGWPYGEAWGLSDDCSKLTFLTSWSSRNAGLGALTEAAKRLEYAKGRGQVGRVWRSAEPEWISDMTQVSAQDFLRREVGHKLGIRSTVGIPVVVAGQVDMVLEFAMRELRPDDVLLAELVAVVAGHVGTLVGQREMEQILRSSEVDKARAETLAQTSLAASHYLRNAIAPIIGYAELIEMGSDQHVKDLINAALTNGRTIEKIIDALEQLAVPRTGNRL